MIKKAALALFSMIFAVALMTPQKANAQVVVGVAPRPYVYVAPPVYAPGYYYHRPYYAYRGYYGPRYYGGHYYRYGWRR